ncbi:MAG TPA: hypothetical protein PK490_08245 [Prosthecobacter sp.]|nr:hypothetical protein [Prosthecobacter sp.]HRK14268.1 hypothetical protein [Prosthecobacter sp.]
MSGTKRERALLPAGFSRRLRLQGFRCGEESPRPLSGAEGPQGPEGAQGNDGPQGPPFASAVVDDVFTVPPGQPATVGVWFDGTQVHFTFEIPRGENGSDGPSGEVSQQQLDDAIAGTSPNSNAVATLGLSISDPPTAWEVQEVANKLDELIYALRRQ